MSRDVETESDAFASTLRAAISRRKLSLSDLHRRLRDSGNPVAISTLSSWRSGTRHPEGAQSRVALAELERILGLEADALGSLMGPARRPGQVARPGEVFSDDYERIKDETIAALGADPVDHLRELSSSTLVRVGAHGGVLEYRVRALLQATAASVRSLPLLVLVDENATSEPSLFVDGGGRLLPGFTHPSKRMVGARIELDHPVNSPETLILEYGFLLPADYPIQRSVAHGSLRRAREMLLWVQFSADAVPRWVNEFEEDAHEEREMPRRPVRGTNVHAVRRQFGPGYFGLAWGAVEGKVPREGDLQMPSTSSVDRVDAS